MRLSIVVHMTGALVRMFGLTLLVPAPVAAWYREWHDVRGFVVAAAACIDARDRHAESRRPGRGRRRGADAARRRIGRRLSHLAGHRPSCRDPVRLGWRWASIDALFESMSGLTTTGATVFTDFSAFGRGIFFWRAMTQWLGGMGVIALFVAVLPRLAIGGRQLFFAEAPGPTDEKLTPQLRKTALALWQLYFALTALQVVALRDRRHEPVRRGVPRDDDDGGRRILAAPAVGRRLSKRAIDWIITVFMFIAGANFALQYRAVRGSRTALVRDEEFRAYAGLVLVASLALAAFLMRDGMGVWRRAAPRRVSGGLDSHDDRLRKRGFSAVGRAGKDGAVAAHVRRRMRGIGRQAGRRSCVTC